MSNDQISDVVIVRVNGGITRSGAGKDETVVSAINGGGHLNIYPSDAQMEIVEKWAAALAEFGLVNGVVEFLKLQEANGGGGYTCRSRKRSGQRPHFTIPTEAVGGAANIGARSVVTSRDGNALILRVSQFFSREKTE